MPTRRGQEPFATEQTLGAVSPETPQCDRIRIGPIRTAGGQRLILAVVADGEGGPRAGRAAEAVVGHVFESLTRSRGNDVTSALRSALEEAGRRIYEMGKRGEAIGKVAATAIVLRGHRLHLAHAGHTLAFIVRQGQAVALTRPTETFLGDSARPVVAAGEARGEPLQPGDRVVLATDGLTRTSPEDGRPYVRQGDIASYVSGNPPMEGARHLISLAMGRDVDDNVSVGIVQVKGDRGEPRRIPIGLVVGPLLILALAAAALAVFRPRAPASTAATDFGYVVLVDGAVFRSSDPSSQEPPAPVSRLGTIPSGAFVTAQKTSKLVPQSTFAGVADLSGIAFYLGAKTEVILTALDPHAVNTGTDTTGSFALTLESGDLLVARSLGQRECQVSAGGASVILQGASAGAVGVTANAQEVTFDCLMGKCSLQGGGSTVELGSGEGITASSGTFGESGPTPTSRLQEWGSLCSGCISSP